MFWKRKETKQLEAGRKMFFALHKYLSNAEGFDRAKLHFCYKSLRKQFFHGK